MRRSHWLLLGASRWLPCHFPLIKTFHMPSSSITLVRSKYYACRHPRSALSYFSEFLPYGAVLRMICCFSSWAASIQRDAGTKLFHPTGVPAVGGFQHNRIGQFFQLPRFVLVHIPAGIYNDRDCGSALHFSFIFSISSKPVISGNPQVDDNAIEPFVLQHVAGLLDRYGRAAMDRIVIAVAL